MDREHHVVMFHEGFPKLLSKRPLDISIEGPAPTAMEFTAKELAGF